MNTWIYSLHSLEQIMLRKFHIIIRQIKHRYLINPYLLRTIIKVFKETRSYKVL